MSSLNYLIFLIITTTNFKVSQSLRPFDIRFTRTNCSIITPSMVRFFDCPIKELAKNRGNYITAHVVFNQDITKSVVDFKVSMPGQGKQKVRDLLKFSTDGCQMGNYRNSNPVVNAITKKIVQAGNFHQGCPLKKNFTYTVNNFAMNPDYFPGFTPEMNFSAKFNMYTGKIHLFSAHIDASVIKKKK